MKKILLGLICVLLLSSAPVYALSTFQVVQGGTGATTLTGCLTGNGTSAITGSGTCATFLFPFTTTPNYNSTSTVLGFFNGLFSNASSTFNSSLRLPSLLDGGLAVFSGLVSSGATTTAGTGLTYSGNAFNVNTTQNISRLSNLTSDGFVKTSGGNGTLSVDTNTYATFSYPFPSNATSTLLSFTGGISTTNASTTILSAHYLMVGAVATTTINGVGGITSVTATTTGKLNIPNSATPNTPVKGDIAVDTLKGRVNFNDGIIGTNSLSATSSIGINIASSTLDAMGKTFAIGTTSLQVKNFPEPTTLSGWYCQASTTGAVVVRFGDNTNWTNDGNCNSTGAFTKATTNNTWTAWEQFVVQVGSANGVPNRVTITPTFYLTP